MVHHKILGSVTFVWAGLLVWCGAPTKYHYARADDNTVFDLGLKPQPPGRDNSFGLDMDPVFNNKDTPIADDTLAAAAAAAIHARINAAASFDDTSQVAAPSFDDSAFKSNDDASTPSKKTGIIYMSDSHHIDSATNIAIDNMPHDGIRQFHNDSTSENRNLKSSKKKSSKKNSKDTVKSKKKYKKDSKEMHLKSSEKKSSKKNSKYTKNGKKKSKKDSKSMQCDTSLFEGSWYYSNECVNEFDVDIACNKDGSCRYEEVVTEYSNPDCANKTELECPVGGSFQGGKGNAVYQKTTGFCVLQFIDLDDDPCNLYDRLGLLAAIDLNGDPDTMEIVFSDNGGASYYNGASSRAATRRTTSSGRFHLLPLPDPLDMITARQQRAGCSNCVDPTIQTKLSNICPSGVTNEGYLKSVNADDKCIPPEKTGYSYFQPERCFERDDAWAYCATDKKLVSLKTNPPKCLEYFDRYWWNFGGDSINIEDCRGKEGQKFDMRDQRTTRVKTSFSSGAGSKSERVEFTLKSVTGSDNCVNSDPMDEDSCGTNDDKRFFFRNHKFPRFEADDEYKYPTMWEEIHDGIIAAKLVYGLGKVRFDYKYRKWIDYRKSERTPLFLFDGAPTTERPLPLSKLWEEMDTYLYTGVPFPTNSGYINRPFQWNNLGTYDDEYCLFKKDECTENFQNFMNILKTKDRLNTTQIWYLSSDTPSDSPLLWGIFIEGHANRVSVWVKGSAGPGSDEDLYYWKDWAEKNAKCGTEDWSIGEPLVQGMKPKVHNGYRAAVDANYATIVDQLHELYTTSEIKDTIKDYKIYVFGHSMGASTSQLIAYRLALNKYRNTGKYKDLPAPISNINFSAPQTGDKNWYKSSMILEREGMLRHLRAYHRDDWAPQSAGGSSPAIIGGAACTVTNGNYFDVGVQMRVDFPNEIEFLHAQEENDLGLGLQGPDYTTSRRRLDGKVDEGHDQSSRALGTNTGTLPAPYNFIEEYESCSNIATCGLNNPGFWHGLETMLMEVYIANRDKKGIDEDLDGKSLNQLYERYLG